MSSHITSCKCPRRLKRLCFRVIYKICCFAHKHIKNAGFCQFFGPTCAYKMSHDLVTGGLIFAIFVLKRCAILQRKKSSKIVTRSAAVATQWKILYRRGTPPPPSSGYRVNSVHFFRVCSIKS